MKNTTDANNATDTLHSQAVNGLLTKIVNEIDKLDATGAYEQRTLVTKN